LSRIKNPRGREDEDEGESEGITGEKDEEGEGRMVGVDGVVVASRRPAVASTAGARGRLASGSRVVPRAAFLQDPIRRVGGVDLFRAVEGAEWPNLASFLSGPYLTERLFLVQPGFELGHADPGGSGRDPGHSGPKRTRP